MASQFGYAKMQVLKKLASAVETASVMARSVGDGEEREKLRYMNDLLMDVLAKIKEMG